MPDLATGPEFPARDRLIEVTLDETGLAGTYDIEVQGEMQGLEELRHALIEQLALVLTRTQRDLPVLAVYRVTS